MPDFISTGGYDIFKFRVPSYFFVHINLIFLHYTHQSRYISFMRQREREKQSPDIIDILHATEGKKTKIFCQINFLPTSLALEIMLYNTNNNTHEPNFIVSVEKH
jgi:hypothetical protein